MQPEPSPTSAPGETISQPIAVLARRKGRLAARLQTAAIVAILVAVASIPTAVIYNTWATHRGLIKEWSAAGEACPIATALSPAVQGAKPPPPFTYRGARFAYQVGDAECAAVPVENPLSSAHYTVCQFDTPLAVSVEAFGQKALFTPGMGRGAMITVRDGHIGCTIRRGLNYQALAAKSPVRAELSPPK